MVFAHVAGLPVEETIAQFAPVGLAAVVVLRVTGHRVRSRSRRATRRPAAERPSPRPPARG
jgi:hypothetical protein